MKPAYVGYAVRILSDFRSSAQPQSRADASETARELLTDGHNKSMGRDRSYPLYPATSLCHSRISILEQRVLGTSVMAIRFMFGMGLLLGQLFCAAAAPQEQLEQLFAAETVDDGLSVTVRSNGCTSERDFLIDTKPSARGTEIRMYRVKPDRCRVVPHRLKLLFSWAELKLKPHSKLIVINPIVADGL
jgi:hypothetical protein